MKTDLDLEACDRTIRRVVARYTKRVWWAKKQDVQDDLCQQGWLVVLECRRTWDEAVGTPFDAYIEAALVRALPGVLWGLSSPASAAKNDRKSLTAHQHGILDETAFGSRPGQELRGDGTRLWAINEFTKYEIAHQGTWADELIADKEWHARTRRALAEITREGDKDVRLGIRFQLDKLDGTEENPGPKSTEFAEREGLPVGKVYKAAYAAKARLACDAELYDLIKERSRQ